jgi:apolipoprotein N-acyltransferase
MESIPMGRNGTIYAKFQVRKGMTPYVRFGDWFAWMACGVVLIGLGRKIVGRPPTPTL